MKRIFLIVVAAALLAGCANNPKSDAIAEALALQSLGMGGYILFFEHNTPAGHYGAARQHIFFGKTGEGDLVYIRVEEDCIVKRVRIKPTNIVK